MKILFNSSSFDLSWLNCFSEKFDQFLNEFSMLLDLNSIIGCFLKSHEVSNESQSSFDISIFKFAYSSTDNSFFTIIGNDSTFPT